MKFITDFLSTPAFIIGLVALLGLLALRKSGSDIVKGTIKTILGFLILQQGAGIIVNSLIPFSQLFENAFNLTGIIAEDNAIAAAVQTVLSKETSFILVLGFLINLLLARVTKMKYIFLTGHMMFSSAATYAIVLDLMGINGWSAIAIGSVIQGLTSVIFPALAQPFVRKVTGNDNVAFGFWGSSLIWMSGWLGGKFGNKAQSTEDLKISDKFDFLKEMSILMSIVMILVVGITAIFADRELLNQLSGGTSPILFVILTSATFVVGILVLLQGVRMFLAELIPAFKGISEKIVPGAIPALDVPIFYSFAPNATTIGFIMAMIGGIVATFVSSLTTVIVLPSVIGLFFMGAAAGVFGNAMGGRRGAIIAGLVLGFVYQMMVALAFPLVDLTQYGIGGLWFSSPDVIFVILLMKLVALPFGK